MENGYRGLTRPMAGAPKGPESVKETPVERRRKRGSGGVVHLGDRTWRVDVEIARDSERDPFDAEG